MKFIFEQFLPHLTLTKGTETAESGETVGTFSLIIVMHWRVNYTSAFISFLLKSSTSSYVKEKSCHSNNPAAVLGIIEYLCMYVCMS